MGGDGPCGVSMEVRSDVTYFYDAHSFIIRILSYRISGRLMRLAVRPPPPPVETPPPTPDEASPPHGRLQQQLLPWQLQLWCPAHRSQTCLGTRCSWRASWPGSGRNSGRCGAAALRVRSLHADPGPRQDAWMTNDLCLTSFQIFTERYKKGYWDIRAFVTPGGTPSSHSSLCAVSGRMSSCMPEKLPQRLVYFYGYAFSCGPPSPL